MSIFEIGDIVEHNGFVAGKNIAFPVTSGVVVYINDHIENKYHSYLPVCKSCKLDCKEIVMKSAKGFSDTFGMICEFEKIEINKESVYQVIKYSNHIRIQAEVHEDSKELTTLENKYRNYFPIPF